ncbi:MAG: NfeD family protein [Pseudomonadota bacterium]
MKPHSFLWWLAVIPTSVAVGVPTFFVLGLHTEWGAWERVFAAFVCTAVVELAIVAWIQRAAPTEVRVGPGERDTVNDAAVDEAVVLSGFDDSRHGRVAVRGETWRAVRDERDEGDITLGSVVNVVDRVGLSLVISAKRD